MVRRTFVVREIYFGSQAHLILQACFSIATLMFKHLLTLKTQKEAYETLLFTQPGRDYTVNLPNRFWAVNVGRAWTRGSPLYWNVGSNCLLVFYLRFVFTLIGLSAFCIFHQLYKVTCQTSQTVYIPIIFSCTPTTFLSLVRCRSKYIWPYYDI